MSARIQVLAILILMGVSFTIAAILGFTFPLIMFGVVIISGVFMFTGVTLAWTLLNGEWPWSR